MLNVETSSPVWTLPAPAPAPEIPHAINLGKMAEIHDVSTKTIKVWISTGKLLKPSIQHGNVWIWYRDDWEAWKEKRRRKMSWAT